MTINLLSPGELDDALADLDDWELVGDGIQREIEFDSFMEAIDFINRIAQWAEEFDHHPEIQNVYTTVSLYLTTHDAGGLTSRDIELAAKIDGEV